nr:septal ring lytic transglycosylase RlpA family protein [Myxosarcina sp. GI1]
MSKIDISIKNRIKLIGVATFCTFACLGTNTAKAATVEQKSKIFRRSQSKVQLKSQQYHKQSLSITKDLLNSNSQDLKRKNLVTRERDRELNSNSNYFQLAQTASGQASWYGPKFHGRPTASGEQFNQNAHTAAHPSLPFGTQVKVTNVNNGRSVVVRINDRGPFVGGRIIDLSAAAARAVGLVQSGVAPVRLQILGR